MSDMNVIQPVSPALPEVQPVPEVPAIPVVTKVESTVKTGVVDFEKAVAYLEHSIAVLGEDARAEIVALAQKYL